MPDEPILTKFQLKECKDNFTTLSNKPAHLAAIVEERHTLYDERDNTQRRESATALAAANLATSAALEATKQATTAAFASNKEAIVKAELAQSQYNASHNGLVKRQDELVKKMMPRDEFGLVVKNLEDKFDSLVVSAQESSRTHIKEDDTKHSQLQADINLLRDNQIKGMTKDEVLATIKTNQHWGVSTLIGIIAICISIMSFISQIIMHYASLAK